VTEAVTGSDVASKPGGARIEAAGLRRCWRVASYLTFKMARLRRENWREGVASAWRNAVAA